MISVVWFSTAVHAVGGRNGREGFPKGRPLSYWGFFSDTKCCGSEKALINYGFSVAEKPRARSGRMVGDVSMMCPTAGADVEREPTVRRPCAPGGILPNPIGRTEAERLNNYTALPVMAAATIAQTLNVFLLFALPVEALKFPKVPITESSTRKITGGAANSSVTNRRAERHEETGTESESRCAFIATSSSRSGRAGIAVPRLRSAPAS